MICNYCNIEMEIKGDVCIPTSSDDESFIYITLYQCPKCKDVIMV